MKKYVVIKQGFTSNFYAGEFNDLNDANDFARLNELNDGRKYFVYTLNE